MKEISQIDILMRKGVKIPNPGSVEIGSEIDPDRISGDNVVLHAGSRIFGKSTLILPGAQIGYEGPVTIENCYVGSQVKMAGGFFKQSVFLKKAELGSGAHVREGTILEEMAGIAHTVGLKQTILFPFVTLGSLINFCDCFMAGGTSRKNHSEVGSSYIHFNYTPNQDKATPSLLGDVPNGVMLKQPPIFLGGQGGLVGPCRIAYGTIIAAGSIFRKDMMTPGKMLSQAQHRDISIHHTPGLYRSIKRVVLNNLVYIANLIALSHWYADVRALFVSRECPDQLLQGCIEILNINIKERILRLCYFVDKLPESAKLLEALVQTKTHPVIRQKLELNQKWPEIAALLHDFAGFTGDQRLKDRFLAELTDGIAKAGNDYLDVIRGLDQEQQETGTKWLQGIVDDILEKTLRIIPSFENLAD